MNAIQPPDDVYSTPGADALHTHFGLSYANYLTVPRSVLQSMPDDWQGKMAALLGELDSIAVRNGVDWPPDGFWICVELRPDSEREGNEPNFVDVLADYQRGRRRLWRNEAQEPA